LLQLIYEMKSFSKQHNPVKEPQAQEESPLEKKELEIAKEITDDLDIEQHSKGITIKKIVQLSAMFVLAVILLYFSFREVKWDGFIEDLRKCNYWWILTSMAVGFMGFIFRSFRWRLLMLPLNKNITKREAYDGTTIAYLTNFAFPRAGELARCGVIAKSGKTSFEGALGTVVLERSFDMICLIIFVLAILIFKWNEFGTFMSRELFAPLLQKFSGAGIWWLGGISVGILVLIYLLARIFRTRLLKLKFIQKVSKILHGLAAGIMSAFKMKNKWLFLAYTAGLWGTYWLTSYTTILAFPSVGHLTMIDAMFLMVVGGLGWVVPVQGGLGAYHFIVSLALATVYAIPQTEGVVFATISHESQAIMMIICGAVSLISINLSGKTIKKHALQ
jgi:glycosyltransferase 2 family protein